MNYNRRPGAAAQRAAERREREDRAPRLTAECPELKGLKLEIEESSGGSPVAEPKHTKRVVVDHAPALFLLPCGDGRCQEGGHDLTYAIMRALRERQTKFVGEDSCNGSVGSAPCGRTLHFETTAEYKG